jgi:hypothetical protein
MLRYLITEKSGNAKVGPIMVTTSPRATCPEACPFKKNGCYAEGYPLSQLWTALDNGQAGERSRVSSKQTVGVKSHEDLLDAIQRQPEGSMWRHNQAGDLAGSGDHIDGPALATIVEANRGRRGFTYTHKPMHNEHNRKAVKDANAAGFTVNLSANSLAHADELAALNIGPVVTVMAHDATENTTTPEGRKVVVCPATQRDDVSCATCGLCSRQRSAIVGFPAHGASKAKASAIAKG